MAMTINVDELLQVRPHYEMQRPFSLDLEVIMTPHQMENLFYKIWEYVEDEQLRRWIEAEGYELIKKEKI